MDNGVGLGYAYAQSQRRDEALEKLRHFEERALTEYIPPTWPAMIHASLGNNDAAFEWLERGLEVRNREMLFLNVAKQWEPLRDDPRFAPLVARIKP